MSTIPYRIRRILQQVAVLFVVFASPLYAQEVYSVSDVTVDVTAASAREAREKALVDGQRLALEKLLKKLTPADQHPLIPKVTDRDVQRLAISLRVQKERYSKVRYIATLAYEFDGNGVRHLLGSRGIDYDYTNQGQVRAEAPTLVLPVYDTGKGQYLLWESANPWFKAWKSVLPEGSAVAVLPKGSNSDSMTIKAIQAMNGDWLAMARLAERYGTRMVVVAVARVEADGSLDVEAVRYQQGERRSMPPANPGRTAVDATRLQQAARAVYTSLELNRPRTGGTRGVPSLYASASTVPVRFIVSDLTQWMQFQQKMRGVPVVRSITPTSLTPDLVVADIRYTGTSADLVDALAVQGLYLVQTNQGWVLDDQPVAVVPEEIPVGQEAAVPQIITGEEPGAMMVPADVAPANTDSNATLSPETGVSAPAPAAVSSTPVIMSAPVPGVTVPAPTGQPVTSTGATPPQPVSAATFGIPAKAPVAAPVKPPAGLQAPASVLPVPPAPPVATPVSPSLPPVVTPALLPQD
jgi:hypothetical protein